MTDRTNNETPGARRWPRRGAFTLIELMVSIALVLILLIGINQVFKMSSDTVSAGQTLSEATRDARAAQAIMNEDFRNVVREAPVFYIHNETSLAQWQAETDMPPLGMPPTVAGGTPTRPWGFLTEADRREDVDEAPATLDANKDGTERHVKVPALSVRNHRMDMVGFFARGAFRRQTANDTAFTSDLSSTEAWVWYGHPNLYLDAAATQSTRLGTVGTPNELATNLALGRVVMLLREPVNGEIKEGNVAQWYMGSDGQTGTLTPLAYQAGATNNGTVATGTPWRIQQARYDLAGTTVDGFRTVVTAAHDSAYPPPQPPIPNPPPTPVHETADYLRPMAFRYDCAPGFKRPLQSRTAALMSPYFVGRTSQFIVEFAGDFVKQDATGQPTGTVEPGQEGDGMDFVLDGNVRRIRWYGLPRDVTGDGKIKWGVDVVPVRDLRRRAGLSAADAVASFEMETRLPTYRDTNGAGDYGTIDNDPNGPAGNSVLESQKFVYTCAWRNGSPMMVRVLMKSDDPAGRVQDGPWLECVFDLRH